MKVKSMPQRQTAPLLMSVAAAGLLALSLSACSMGSGLALSNAKVQGYAISQDALAQIRPGQSQELVTVVLGSPQTVNAFDSGTAWYYVETKVDQTAFGMTTVKERTVLAVYFDKNKKVADKALYSAKDGKVFTIEGRKTPSYGEDKSFIDSLIESI
ncbi:MAG: outer membrane protein assembly factor BamE [Devosia sp.]|uniref:outer membrane protein assembly factor BamE n=1 Tax=Devosia sp. TaxID=1871048 RepID=UPI001A3BC075|nr:outer membrane protein assembly factor BamE [Devosia sp.]MBL8599126.1 outer membrane protein assembly factor BamE [Devosia sp.]